MPDIVLSIRVRPEVERQFRRAAESEGTSFSEWAQRAIWEALAAGFVPPDDWSRENTRNLSLRLNGDVVRALDEARAGRPRANYVRAVLVAASGSGPK